jgi:site-specific DNA recombinase
MNSIPLDQCDFWVVAMARIIGYARVSSREQADNSHALEQQIARLKAEGAEVVYAEVESGYKGKRYPQRDQVMALVRSNQVAEVITTRIDRLSRRGVQSFAIFEEFIKSGVTLRCLDEQVDLSNAAGRMVAGVLAVMAQNHSDQKTEMIRAGWAHLRSRKTCVNPPFGYRKVDDRAVLDVEPFVCLLSSREELSKAAIGRLLVDEFLKRKSLRLTLRWFNTTFGITTTAHNNAQGEQLGGRVTQKVMRFSPYGLSNWLTNPCLLGHTAYLRKSKRIIHYDTHPDQRLITEEEAAAIAEILDNNRQTRGFGSTAPKYPLSGLVYCGECQAAHHSQTGQKNYHKAKRLGIPPELNYYYQCKNWRSRGCNQKAVIRMEVVEAAVVAALIERSNEIATIADRPDEIVEPPELIALRQELTALRQLPNQSRVSSTIVEVESQIETAVRQQQSAANQYSSNQQLLQQVFSDRGYWESLEPQERREIYRGLVRRVVVRYGTVEKIELKV